MDLTSLTFQFYNILLDWRGILDILLIAMGFFLVYRTFQRQGAWKIATGVFIAMAFFAIANFLDLSGIMWIYTNLSHVALIGLIVIFQPELRKVLERAASMAKGEPGREEAGLCDMLSQATFNLAGRRWGALLVFPGKEPIEGHISGGSLLSAHPGIPLLLSIFDTGSPGHDGAVIVENGKLTHLGVRLPLSLSNTLPDHLGTRHNAAMGLCEQTDALVVAVSEERGAVTVFQDGRYEPVVSPEDLAQRIKTHWRERSSYAIPLRAGRSKWRVFSELGVSLVLALVFWAAVIPSQGEILERVFPVQVEYTATPDDIALVGNKPVEIKLHLTGPKSELDALNPGNLVVKIDLSKSLPGAHMFQVTEENVRLPKDVRLLDADPGRFELSLKRIVASEVNIEPQLIGHLPAGVQLLGVDVIPRTVRVLSPDEGKKNKEIIKTTPIYLDVITTDTKIFCKVIAPPSLQPEDKRWPDVEVTIRVQPR